MPISPSYYDITTTSDTESSTAISNQSPGQLVSTQIKTTQVTF